jgi:hypothetical protein
VDHVGVVTDLVVDELDRVHVRIADRFIRSEPRAREYLCGLVAGLERKNGWTLAEQAGEVCPDGMQRLIDRKQPAPQPPRSITESTY